MSHTLPQLPYGYDELEPYIDARTMEIHYTKHHQGYVDNLNKALSAHPELQEKPLEELLTSLNSIPEDIRSAVQNNAGGHFNHSLFWQMLKPQALGGGGEPAGVLSDALNSAFGNSQNFKDEFAKAALGRFGSGWAWLVADGSGALSVMSTPNQDSPITSGLKPLLGLDVWEHAYYLKYQNKRADYISAFWNIVNWDDVASRLSV